MEAVPMFAGLGAGRIAELRRRARARDVAAGAVVAGHRQPADRLIVVERGTLAAVRDTVAGRRLRLGEHRGPCAVDKAAVLDGRGYTATWTAVTAVRVRLLPAGDFRRLLDEEPGVRRHVLRSLAAQVRDREDGLVEAHYADAGARVAAWLARQPANPVRLPAQERLAEVVGASRVTVNRALRRLHRAGIIRVERGGIVVLDPERLR